jgi:hypothetical protein
MSIILAARAGRDEGLMTGTKRAIAAALALFAVWTATTWFLEGRSETFLRPEATTDRLLYALVANLLIGIVGAIVILRFVLRSHRVCREAAGFGSAARTAIAIAAGLVLGLAFYALAGGPTSDPIVLTNAFAQVLVVSAAEVVVCWAVVGSVFEAAARGLGRLSAVGLAAVIASVLFGAYHFAHSPPFNTMGMVAFLSVIGLVTSLFFFVSRDVYGTIVFHNFMGVLGVVNALAAKGLLQDMSGLQPRLLATAATTVLVLAAADKFVIRRSVPDKPDRELPQRAAAVSESNKGADCRSPAARFRKSLDLAQGGARGPCRKL